MPEGKNLNDNIDKALEIISQIIDALYYMKKVVVGNT
jgi:hypothetical protein